MFCLRVLEFFTKFATLLCSESNKRAISIKVKNLRGDFAMSLSPPLVVSKESVLSG